MQAEEAKAQHAADNGSDVARLWRALVLLEQGAWRVMPDAVRRGPAVAKAWEEATASLIAAQVAVGKIAPEHLQLPAPAEAEVPVASLLGSAEAARADLAESSPARTHDQSRDVVDEALALTRQALEA
jgi:hypothetical protein